jgi:hypothetical protein
MIDLQLVIIYYRVMEQVVQFMSDKLQFVVA